jgi:hypothetical protein
MNARTRKPPPTTSREGAGRVTPEQLAAWAALAYPNAVRNLAHADTDEQRKAAIAVFAKVRGEEAADKLRRDVWAQMQMMAKGQA